jgi:hypothetical protein
MKPFSIVLFINLSLVAVWGLVFAVLIDRPEIIPLMTSLQAALNFLGAGVFFLDRKKDIALAFVWGTLIVAALTVIGYAILLKYQDRIGLDENLTVMLEGMNGLIGRG